MPATRKTLFLCMYLNKWHVSKVRAFNISIFYLGLQASFQASFNDDGTALGTFAGKWIHSSSGLQAKTINRCQQIWNKIYVSAREGDRTKRE